VIVGARIACPNTAQWVTGAALPDVPCVVTPQRQVPRMTPPDQGNGQPCSLLGDPGLQGGTGFRTSHRSFRARGWAGGRSEEAGWGLPPWLRPRCAGGDEVGGGPDGRFPLSLESRHWFGSAEVGAIGRFMAHRVRVAMIRAKREGRSLAGFSDFVAELKRRRVIRALLGWGIASFAILQVYEPVMHGLHLPEWTLSFVVVALGLGFPVTVGLAWVFDLGPRGIEWTPPASSPEATWPARSDRGRLALLLVVGLAAAAPGLVYFFVWPGAALRDAGQASPAPQSPPSVAVLPFSDLSAQKDQAYLADGIAEEILNALAHVKGLRVTGRTSSFWFKDKGAKLADMGRELGVRTILEGREPGSDLRAAPQCGRRVPPLVGDLRPRPHGHLPDRGRDRPGGGGGS
jgi:hypothetical protein